VERSRPKKAIIDLKFQLEDERSRAKGSVPREREVKGIRKITSFERGRRAKHHEVDDASYNNNG
jgi:hypothetical protein